MTKKDRHKQKEEGRARENKAQDRYMQTAADLNDDFLEFYNHGQIGEVSTEW